MTPRSEHQAQFTIPSLGVGIIQIGASYSGDTNYAISSATLQETVNPVSTSTSVTFTARITPAQMGAAPVSGTVYLTAMERLRALTRLP